MTENIDLDRFLTAQVKTYPFALKEIKKGRKVNHWMWFIFPQIRGLGNSIQSLKYSINSKDEAIRYFNHPVLGARLLEISEELLAIENKTAKEIMGFKDEIKLKSSMTLFATIQTEYKVFQAILDKYFNGQQCQKTLSFLGE
jgi:uncharacterized protein (DUF1810 family)